MSTPTLNDLIPEEWDLLFEGKRHCTPCGPRDVLIIKSDESLSLPDIQPRKKYILTEIDKEELKKADIPIKYWNDELKILESKLNKDKKLNIISIIDDPAITSKDIIEKITLLFQLTAKPGVFIIFIGPGKKATGDWCFKDGCITFYEIMRLYHKYYIGKFLGIISDCSYSGVWVNEARNHLDKYRAGPCLHSAKACGILLCLITSCQSNEVPYSLLFLAKAFTNDKNTGLFIFDFPNHLTENQNVCLCSNLTILCTADSIDSDCLFPKDYPFENYERDRRLILVKVRSGWALIVLDDYEALYRICFEQTYPFDVGEIVASGEGEQPDDATKKKIDEKYPGHLIDWTTDTQL